MRKKSVLLASLVVTLLLVGIVCASAPVEQVLGADARLVYLHGAWVWAALAGILSAAVVGLAGWVLNQPRLHTWSRALGRTGLLLWITFLPLSLVVMKTSWNGLFLAEPRWRMSLEFAIAGLLLQAGGTLVEPRWASLANLGFGVALFYALPQTQIVMHPPAPILNTQSFGIRESFALLLVLLLLFTVQIAFWFHSLETRRRQV